MKLSTVNSTRIGSRDKSLTEIASVQGLQSLLTNNAIASCLSCDFNKVSGVPLRSPQVQHKRLPQPEAYQLNLLTLLEKSLESALQIEPVPVNVTVGVEQRFWLVHQPTGLRVPGQFSQAEAEYILGVTEKWNWAIEYRPRTPNCNKRLLSLLTAVCTPPSKVLECAA